MNDENVNIINTHTASLSEPHSPLPSSPVVVDCCECGCDGLGLLCSNVRVCSVVGVSMCEILPRGKISNTNEQLDRVWRHSLFQKSGPRA